MSSQGRKDRDKRPTLEWVVGVVSAVIVAGILAFLGREAVFGDRRPPNLVAAVDRIEAVEGGTLIMIVLSNSGDQAAAEVAVEATIDSTDAEPLQKEISFDYVASHSVRRGAFMVEGPAPSAADIRLNVHGYVQP